MYRLILYITFGAAVAMALAYAMARQYGMDPFSDDMTLYWAVVAITGVYVSVRIAGILNRRKKKGETPGDLRPRRSKRRPASPDSLDARMEARRERVRRAQERQAAAGAPPTGAGDEEG